MVEQGLDGGDDIEYPSSLRRDALWGLVTLFCFGPRHSQIYSLGDYRARSAGQVTIRYIQEVSGLTTAGQFVH